MGSDFHGAKLAILVRSNIVTILRDDLPDIAWPAHWDLPGGAREGEELPEQAVLRELNEELGLTLDVDAFPYRRRYPSQGSSAWFFALEWAEFDPERVQFGGEGQR